MSIEKVNFFDLTKLKENFDYITDYRATTPFLISGINCSPFSIYEDFSFAHNIYTVDPKKECMKFVISYSKDDNIPIYVAHNLSREFLDRFDGFQFVLATHINSKNPHTHVIANSVRLSDGQKLYKMVNSTSLYKQEEEFCLEHHIPINVYGSDYQMDKSFINTIIEDILPYSINYRDFEERCKNENIMVRWSVNHISYTYNYSRIRDTKLCDDRLLLKNLLLYFQLGPKNKYFRNMYLTHKTENVEKKKYNVGSDNALYTKIKNFIDVNIEYANLENSVKRLTTNYFNDLSTRKSVFPFIEYLAKAKVYEACITNTLDELDKGLVDDSYSFSPLYFYSKGIRDIKKKAASRPDEYFSCMNFYTDKELYSHPNIQNYLIKAQSKFEELLSEAKEMEVCYMADTHDYEDEYEIEDEIEDEIYYSEKDELHDKTEYLYSNNQKEDNDLYLDEEQSFGMHM